MRDSSLSMAVLANCRLGPLIAVLLIGCLPALMVPTLLAQTASEIQGTVSDQQGLPISGAEIVVNNPARAIETKLTTDSNGSYRVVGLPPGTYAVKATCKGLTAKVYTDLVLPVNRTLQLDIILAVGNMEQQIIVKGELPLLEASASSSGSTIVPAQVESMPINGRNYLDLLQLVPGVTIDRRAVNGDDNSAPVLGERAGNAVFLIDGQPNRDELDGGPGADFDQDAILEFQVLTSGYKAEFGHGSGGIVNVVTKSGTNKWHGTASSFHRNYLLDSSNVAHTASPFLLRWDTSATLGGPIVKDRAFLFGSVERIRESRESNFQFPPDLPASLVEQEQQLDKHNQTYESRGFARLDEQWNHHGLTQQINLTNTHLTDVGFLPSTRINRDLRRLMLGFHDTATLGDQSNPHLLDAYVQYRGEPSVRRPAHLEAGLPSTFVNLFSSLTTEQFFGDVAQDLIGPGFTPLALEQKYVSTGVSVATQLGGHGIKFGWDLQRTRVNGTEAVNIFDALFATVSDFNQFGLENSGVHVLFIAGGATPDRNRIRLHNTYNGLFLQDDWKLRKSLTVNLGLRWDYDSEFPNKTNLSPRLGLAWSVTPKTVLRASWGVFYDHFRIGIARDIPEFGGAEITSFQTVSFPRLFYGDPTIATIFSGLCLSPNQTDAEIAASGATCPLAPLPFYGVDHLNSVVAAGHAPIPANAVVTIGTVHSMAGLTPQQFVDGASVVVGESPGFFSWDSFGHLSAGFLGSPASRVPITAAPGFHTPYTRAFHFGIEREVGKNLLAYVDLFHKEIRNILGVRTSNLAFEARLPGRTGETVPGTEAQLINSYGPWFSGRYDAAIVGFRKRLSGRFMLEANYTYAHAVDNLLNSNFVSDVQTGLGVRLTAFGGPTDSFVGVPPVVTDPISGQSNAHGPFIASNGNPVPQAGKFYYGPDLDRGPSDLALTHTFLAHGLVQLPRQFEVSAIFRVQRGFHYSRTFFPNTPDVDGDGIPNFVDFTAGRNHFTAPPYVNLDLRFSKRFRLGDSAKLQVLIEFFDLFNRANPSQVQSSLGAPQPFGIVTQVLPGREGQVGIKIEF